MHKKLVCLFMALFMLVAATAQAGDAGMKPGDYTVVCRGFYGDFDITVSVSEDAITGIAVGDYLETEEVGGDAIRIMTNRMLAENTAIVDTVTGATVTSAVFRAAVTNALKEANAPDALLTAREKPPVTDESLQTDVLVIGAGAAGFSAAITARQAGANVILIEKQDILGGSTVVSAGIVYAALDETDTEKMVDYYMTRAEGNADRDMLTVFAENSLDTIAFLEESGVQWMMSVPAGTAPEPRARFSMHADGRAMIGSSLTKPLEMRALDLGVTIMAGVKATELVVVDGAVVGALAESKETNYTFEAGAVILATGGYDASPELSAKYAPVSAGDVVLSNKGNVGEGLVMALDIGAASQFNNSMIGFQAVSGSLPESGMNAVAMNAPLYVQGDGTFISVQADYPITYTNLKASGAETFFGIFDAAGEGTAEQALAVNFAHKADTLEELAAAAGMDADKLADAVAQAESLVTAPYYAVVVRPASIGSMGGLVTDTGAAVLSEATQQPIPGLYAAGEVANPAFYYREYPASGSSNSISMTFGRIAGVNAAAYVKGE